MPTQTTTGPKIPLSNKTKQDSLVVDSVRGETDQAGDGDGRPVGPAHEEPPQDNLVEGSITAAGQEPVQLSETSRMVRKVTRNHTNEYYATTTIGGGIPLVSKA